MSTLESFSTRELVEELKKRPGILSTIEVPPHEAFELHTGGHAISEIGPAVILIVVD